ncbi:carbohydrate ABC transporter substrate-binding protein [[Eubacterium] hominis]|uniref:carbohydrate ABC transporter substrate-binding protein n=1 Tax=[Eubacterium] hominis TaxID=2764325 RepID=UPI003A4DE874
MKKLLKVGCSALVLATLVAGCGSKGGDDGKKEVPTNADGKRILKFDAFSGGNGEEVWKDMKEAFEKANSDVVVELRFEQDLPAVLNKENASGTYSDVVYYNLGQATAFTETQLNSGEVLDISDVMKEVSGNLDTQYVDAVAQYFGDGKSYVAPIMYTPAGLYYNTELIGEGKKYAMPTTWDDMFALGDKAKENGTTLFTYPVKGYFDMTIMGMLYQAGNEEYFTNALKYAEGTWDSENGKKITDTIAKLVDKKNGYLYADTVANANVDKGFTKNQQAMIDGKALFMPNGSWIVNEMKETTPKDFHWGVMPLPAFEKDGQRVVSTFTEQVWVPAKAANPDDAKAFIKFLYSEEGAKIFAKYNVVSPVKGSQDLIEDQQLKDLFSVYKDETVKPVIGNYAAYDATKLPDLDFKKTMYGPIDDIASGKDGATAEKWNSELVELWKTVAANPIATK